LTALIEGGELEETSILPRRDEVISVIGGKALNPNAKNMACMLGYEILAAGFKLITGGRRGAGEYASLGAAEYCREKSVPLEKAVFALVPFGQEPEFSCCRCVHAGKNKLERSATLMSSADRALVVGGGVGTLNEVMFAAVDYYMAWDMARVIPVSGTGGVADRILREIRGFDDSCLNDPAPSPEKARLVVRCRGPYFAPLDILWGIDVHEAFGLCDSCDPVVRRFAYIRHTLGRVEVEGED
jgi:uncharacterized protein (TIGR00725 family)